MASDSYVLGPVVGIMPVADDAEAVRLMNDSPYGLTGSVWTEDMDRAARLMAAVEAGTVHANRCDYLDIGRQRAQEPRLKHPVGGSVKPHQAARASAVGLRGVERGRAASRTRLGDGPRGARASGPSLSPGGTVVEITGARRTQLTLPPGS